MQVDNRFLRATILAALPLALLACGGKVTSTSAPELDRAADEAAIREVFAGLEAAANRSDPEATASLYTPDGDIWIAGGDWVKGTAEIIQFEEEFYQNPGYQNWHGTIHSIRFISPDAALLESSSVTTLDDGEMRDSETITLVRRDGAWKIAAVRIMTWEE